MRRLLLCLSLMLLAGCDLDSAPTPVPIGAGTPVLLATPTPAPAGRPTVPPGEGVPSTPTSSLTETLVPTEAAVTPTPVQGGLLPLGQWQGAGVTIWSGMWSSVLVAGVGIGHIDTGLVVDRLGQFASTGVIYPAAGGPGTPVAYQGWSDGHAMTLTIGLAPDNRPLAIYHLTYGPQPVVRMVRSGIWAGPNIDLWIGDSDGIVGLGCNSGTIQQPLALDPQGRFTGLGEVEVCLGGCWKSFAFYSGITDGQTMTLTLRPVDPATTGDLRPQDYPFGTFTLTYVRAAPRTHFPTPGDCPI